MDVLFEILHRWLAPLGTGLPPLYLVGGAVRDHLLRRTPKDIDLMCRDPEAFARRLGAFHDAAVVPFTGKADTPCFRVVSRGNSEDFLDIVGIQGGSVEADLARRDFTCNAMAMRVQPDGSPGELIDLFGGRRDLGQRCIRATGPEIFASDPLRIIRAVRFAAQLGFAIDPAAVGLMKSAAAGLSATAGERVGRELFLVLEQPAGTPHIRMLDEVGALEALFPEIGPMRGCVQNEHHHLDVWGHSLAALEICEGILEAAEEKLGPPAALVKQDLGRHNRLALLKLAALFHDSGKPASRSIAPAGGRVVFHGHEKAGAAAAEGVAGRLKLSACDRAYFENLVGNHMHAIDLSQPQIRLKTLLRWFRRFGDDMVPLIILSMADTQATRGPASSCAERERHIRWARETISLYYSTIREQLASKPLIDGRDLLAMGVPPGPGLGRILQAVREAQDEKSITTREEALALAKGVVAEKKTISSPAAKR
jgi:tRNA nucleotidyltransferase/poly(A) polymerase